jgi:hypothetical protein
VAVGGENVLWRITGGLRLGDVKRSSHIQCSRVLEWVNLYRVAICWKRHDRQQNCHGVQTSY